MSGLDNALKEIFKSCKQDPQYVIECPSVDGLCIVECEDFKFWLGATCGKYSYKCSVCPIEKKKCPIKLAQRIHKPEGVIDQYIEIFTQYSFNNFVYAQMTLHEIVGQLLKKCYYTKKAVKMDLREGIMLIQDKRSGKNTCYPMIKIIHEKLGLTIIEPTELSDASLIKGIEVNPKTGEKSETEGDLEMCDTYFVGEASVLFKKKPRTWEENMRIYFNKVHDTYFGGGTVIEKRLKGKHTKTVPYCSLYFTTFPPRDFDDMILNEGILHRLLLYIRRLTRKEVRDNVNLNIDCMSSGEYTPDMREIVKKFKVVQDKYKDGIRFIIPDFVAQELKKVSNEYLDEVEKCSPTNEEILRGFIISTSDHAIKLACHRTALRLDEKVDLDDLKYGIKLAFGHCFKNLMIWIESSGNIPRTQKEVKIQKVKDIILKNPNKSNAQYIELITNKLTPKISRSTAYRLLEEVGK